MAFFFLLDYQTVLYNEVPSAGVRTCAKTTRRSELAEFALVWVMRCTVGFCIISMLLSVENIFHPFSGRDNGSVECVTKL